MASNRFFFYVNLPEVQLNLFHQGTQVDLKDRWVLAFLEVQEDLEGLLYQLHLKDRPHRALQEDQLHPALRLDRFLQFDLASLRHPVLLMVHQHQVDP